MDKVTTGLEDIKYNGGQDALTPASFPKLTDKQTLDEERPVWRSSASARLFSWTKELRWVPSRTKTDDV
jgi:hypothetical protein